MASVWRNAGSSGGVELSGIRSGVADIIPEDDSCDICMGEDGAYDIWFSPCGHKACASCVQKLRIANVYKADKGVRCPFCRQVIECYLDSPPARRAANSPLPPECASFTLVMGGSAELGCKAVGEIRRPYGQGGIVSIGGGNDYVPPKGVTGGDGGGLRSNTGRMDDILPGYIVPHLKDTDDLVSMAMDRTGARHLDFMLREGYAKRQKVAKLCREMLTPYASKLAVHASGNYVLQRMLEYAASHRAEGGNTESFFTAIVRSFCREKGLVMAALDNRGTFSVQKMLVSLKGGEEANLVATCIRGSVAQLALDQYGVYVLERLVEAMITTLNPAGGKKPRVPAKDAFKILGQICEEIQRDPKSLASVAKHQVSGIVLVECIRWALPQAEAMSAAHGLADMSGDLVGSKLSHRTTQGVLSLEVKEVAERVIEGLEGQYVELASDTINSGFKLVRACLATPCVGENMRVLIVDELQNGVVHPCGHYSLMDNPTGLDTWAFGLCLLSRRILDERLESLVMYLERDKLEFVRERVENMRKHFLNERPKPDIGHGICGPSTASVPAVASGRSRELSWSSCRNDVGPNFAGGCSRGSPRRVVSDPWSEEAPSGGVFRFSHVEKPLARAVSMPLSRPSTPGSRSESSERSPSGEASRGVVESNSSSTMASSGAGAPGGRGASSQGGVGSAYTPPHLRDKGVAPASGQSGGGAGSHSQLPSLEGRSGSYAPPHVRRSSSMNATSPTGFSASRHETESQASADLGTDSGSGSSPRESLNGHSLLPYGSSDFLDFNPDPVEMAPLSGPREDAEHDGQTGEAKSSGKQRQPGVCAVCNRDAANTVLLSCSHMCCCTVCSRAVKSCPICNNEVSSVIDIRPVGVPPGSSASAPQNGAGSAGELASCVGVTRLGVGGGGSASRDDPSRGCAATSRSQGSGAVGSEGSCAKPGSQQVPFRHVAADQGPPGIPVPKQSAFQGVSGGLGSSSSQAMNPSRAVSGGGRPFFLPSDFFPSAMSGNSAPGSYFSPEVCGESRRSASEWAGVNGSGRNGPAGAPRRPPAPYRPPGLYRPPDLFARSAAPVVAQSNSPSVAVPGFASTLAPQWRTYQ